MRSFQIPFFGSSSARVAPSEPSIFRYLRSSLRRRLTFSVSELADLSPSIIGDIEVGRRNPTLTTIEKIALALDIPVQQLFYDSEADYPLSAIESREELRSILHKLVDKAIDG